jgi:hypothetical protein
LNWTDKKLTTQVSQNIVKYFGFVEDASKYWGG